MQDTVRDLEQTAMDLSREAVAFIEENKDRPFFLYYPTTNIHFPLTPNERFKGTTEAGVYGEFTAEFDWAVGQVLDALDRLELTSDTIVVVTSDNGARPTKGMNGHACNGPWRGTKRTIYEGGHRVPLIVRWPGRIKAGSTTDETVCLTDFFRTFASVIGQQVPNDAGEDSYDLSDVLFGRNYQKPLREATVHHSVAGQFAIRKGNWKLIEGSGDGDYPRNENGGIAVVSRTPERESATGQWVKLDYFGLQHDGKFQLYNLADDPHEQNNLAEQNPEQVSELRELLDRYRRSNRSR
jgi:arylsulfatase A-like enzyme